MPFAIRKARTEDYAQIIKLQNANKPDVLDQAARQQGFLSSNMDPEQLQAMNGTLGVLVAVEGDQVAGFVCMAPTAPLPDHPVIQAMHKTFPDQQFHDKPLSEQRAFIYGPVCIDQRWRGQGLAHQLFAAVKDFTREQFELGVAFVDDRNPHSLAVHVSGLGMQLLKPFESAGLGYQLVAFATARNQA